MPGAFFFPLNNKRAKVPQMASQLEHQFETMTAFFHLAADRGDGGQAPLSPPFPFSQQPVGTRHGHHAITENRFALHRIWRA